MSPLKIKAGAFAVTVFRNIQFFVSGGWVNRDNDNEREQIESVLAASQLSDDKK